MPTVYRPMHAVCRLNTRGERRAFKTATTSTKVRVLSPTGSSMVGDTDMTLDATGRHRYHYPTSTGASNGDYKAIYTTISDGVKTVSVDTFNVQDP